MKHTFTPCLLRNFLIFIFVGLSFLANSQTLNAPIKEFGNICASSSFNSYSVNFDFSGFNAGNTFVLEMSDPTGSFSTLTNISIISSQLATSPGRFTFKVPENINTAGKNYRLRIRSTSPAIISASSSTFHAYFWVFNNAIKILDNGSGGLSICGTSGTLSIDPTAPSPLQYSALKYIWKKDGNVLANETASTLTVTSPGIYSVQVDYGNCNSTIGFLAYSQDVTVSFTTNSTSYTINSSLGTDVCPSKPTTLSTTAGQSYQWYRNNTKIDGATAYSYVTAVPGTYKVVVGPGSACESTSNNITLTTEDFNLAIDAKVSPAINYVEAGQSLTITATTNAVDPTFTWLEPGNNVPVSTTDSYTVTTPIDGDYKLKIKQNTGCVFEKEIIFRVKIGVESTKIPNLISPNNNDGENDTWIIPDQYKTSDIEILILDSFGKEVFKMKNYDDSWPKAPIEFKSVNPLFYYVISKGGSALKKGSITVIK